MEREMRLEYIVDLYAKLENLDIKIWIDGGWAVDILVGKVTRHHSDLDIAVEHKNLVRLKDYLQALGYEEIERDENKKWDLVLNDGHGHEVDVHAFSFDSDGDVIEEDDWAGFSKKSLTGLGNINGHTFRCVNFDYLLKTHDSTKRELKEKDNNDIKVLREKFNYKPESITEKLGI